MRFTVNGINLGIPSGAIVASPAHATDPDGYVIADGAPRTINKKYNNIIELGIGTGVVPYLSYQFEGNANDLTGNFNGYTFGFANFSSSIFKWGSKSLIANPYVYIGTPPLPLNTLTNGLSIAFWFRKIGTSTAKIFNFTNATSTFTSTLFGSSLPYNVYFAINGFPYETYVELNQNDVWIHIAFTLTYSTNNTSTTKIYVNGVLEKTKNGMSYPKGGNYEYPQIGQFNGYLDDFNIYDKVLTSDEISTIYSKGGGDYTPPDLRATFLRATDTQTVSSITYTGPLLENYQDNAIQAHTHPGSADAHTHTTASTAGDNYSRTQGHIGMGVSDGIYTESNSTNPNDNNEVNVLTLSDVVFNDAPSQSITVSNAGDNTKETAPFCYGVNWLIKL
jgi:hypothetical protein